MEQTTAKKPKKKLKKRWIALIIAFVVLGLMGSCVAQAMLAKPTLLGSTVKRGELTASISTTGSVSSSTLDEYIVTESTSVKKVNFKTGDSVKTGDVIVEYDHSDALDAYKRAVLTYEQARLNLAEVERRYFDAKEDLDQVIEDIEYYKKKWKEYEGYTDPDDQAQYQLYYTKWETAKAKKESLESSILSADAIKAQQVAFELNKMNLDDAEQAKNNLPANVVAKQDGVIESVGVRELNTAPKGTLAVAIRTAGSNTVDFNIGRYDIGKISLGQQAVVTISGKEYSGVVSHINPVASADSYIKAKVLLDEPEGVIPGVPADIEIETYSADNVIRLPIEAVKTDRVGDYCYILEKSADDSGLYTPVKTYLTIGNTSNLYIEVIDGVTEGQLIASNPPKGIETILVCNVIPQD